MSKSNLARSEDDLPGVEDDGAGPPLPPPRPETANRVSSSSTGMHRQEDTDSSVQQHAGNNDSDETSHDNEDQDARQSKPRKRAMQKATVNKRQMFLQEQNQELRTLDDLEEDVEMGESSNNSSLQRHSTRRQSKGLTHPPQLSVNSGSSSHSSHSNHKNSRDDWRLKGGPDIRGGSGGDVTNASTISSMTGPPLSLNTLDADNEPRPGAVAVPRRAFGQIPVWGRHQPPPQAEEATPRQGFSRRLISSISARSTGRTESVNVPQATQVTDAELIVYPEAIQTSQDLEREQEENRKRQQIRCIGTTLCFFVVLVAGVALGIYFGLAQDNSSSSNENLGGSFDNSSDIDDCEDLFTSNEQDPDIVLQCEFCDKVEVVSDEIVARYDALMDQLNISAPDETSFCEPRNLALLWLANDTLINRPQTPPPGPPQGLPPGLGQGPSCPFGPRQVLVQRYVLALTYFSMGGQDWLRQTNWLSSESFCEWDGVECSFADESVVFKLDLQGQNANGTIPQELGRLCDLRLLQLGSNFLSGPIPSILFQQLRNIRRIGMGDNELSGRIPDVVSSAVLDSVLQMLTEEDIEDFEELSQENKDRINQLREPLYSLDFSHNKFVGDVPDGFGLLPNLREISVDNNQLAGPFTPIVGLSIFRDIEKVGISNNAFTGTMPTLLGKLTRLEYFDISNNDFSGTIVPEIGNLRELTTLMLGNNHFNGTVPDEIRELGRLVDLDLRGEDLEPPLPDGLCDALVFLDPVVWVNCNGTLGDGCKCCSCRSPPTRCPPRNPNCNAASSDDST